MSDSLPCPDKGFLRLLLNPAFTGPMLKRLGAAGQEMEPLFRHTANATIISGGEKANVIPSEVTVNLDCRMLPGYAPEDLLGELQDIAGPDIELRAVNSRPSRGGWIWGCLTRWRASSVSRTGRAYRRRC